MTVRRLSDIALSLALLLVCLPVFALSAIAVWLDQASVPFLRQERVTRDGRRIAVFRLRTSRSTRFGSRSTPLGDFLRAWHLDEIPQLINVLTGELSLLGNKPDFIDEIGRTKVFALRDP